MNLWVVGLAVASVFSQTEARGTVTGSLSAPVVFVCEHGSVKSLIAMQWFNKLAAERGLSVRAVSRGLTPDATVPTAIANQLANDGLAPVGFTPKAISKADLSDGARVVAIGVDLSAIIKDSHVMMEYWKDIPPASENYAASRDAIKTRIEGMLKPARPAQAR